MRMPSKTWVVAIVAAAVLFRIGFYLFALQKLPVSSDEAWPSLMAMHMLKGEFPILYWGQNYMGTQESAIQAVWIALLGPHTWVVRLYPLLFGFLFVAASALLAARIYNREVAWLVLLLLVVPAPYLTMCSILIPPDNYLALTTLGSLSLVLLQIWYSAGNLLRGRSTPCWVSSSASRSGCTSWCSVISAWPFCSSFLKTSWYGYAASSGWECWRLSSAPFHCSGSTSGMVL